MYKFNRNRQFSFSDFNQPIGLKMNPENRWVKKSETIPWDEIEERYSSLFPSRIGMPAKPLQTALGALLIQKQYDYSDRELVEQIRENPYYQYFIGLPGYQDRAPFAPSLLVEFRKRLTDEILTEINEMIAEYNSPDDPPPGNGSDPEDKTSSENRGTVRRVSYVNRLTEIHFVLFLISIFSRYNRQKNCRNYQLLTVSPKRRLNEHTRSKKGDIRTQIVISLSKTNVEFMMLDDGIEIALDEKETHEIVADNYEMLKKLASSVDYQYILNMNYTILRFSA